MYDTYATLLQSLMSASKNWKGGHSWPEGHSLNIPIVYMKLRSCVIDYREIIIASECLRVISRNFNEVF